jgi:hypothetical protein
VRAESLALQPLPRDQTGTAMNVVEHLFFAMLPCVPVIRAVPSIPSCKLFSAAPARAGAL